MKRIISLVLVIVLCLGLCIPAAAASTEKVDITYRAIKIVLNGSEITPCDAAGKTVEPFIMNSNGTTYLPLRAIGQALGLDVKWTPATNTVELTSGGAVKTGDGPAGSTTGKKNVAITYRDIKVILDGTQLTLKNALGQDVEPFILNSNSSVYLPLRVVGEAFGLDVKWEASTSTVYLVGGSEPLTITKQPADVVCAVGDIASFSVEVSGGKAPYSYQWKARGVGEFKNLRNGSGATLELTTTEDMFNVRSKSFISEVQCVITDADGDTVTSKAVKLVKGEPTTPLSFINYVPDAEAKLGDKLSFTFNVAGGTAPYSYQWQCVWDGSEDFENIDNRCKDWASGWDTNTLTMTVGDKDFTYNYRYRLLVTDAKGQTAVSNTIAILDTSVFRITKQPTTAYYAPGGSARFTVEAVGGIEPYQYTWQYGYEGSNYYTVVTSTQYFSGIGTSTLTVLDPTDDFYGGYSYRCIVTDSDGNILVSDSAKMEDDGSLRIATQPLGVQEKVGDYGEYTVKVSHGKEPYSYQWQYRDDNTEFADIDSGDSSWASGWNTPTLKAIVSEKDFQYGCHYRCIITDAEGSRVITGEVGPREPMRITLQPTNVTCNDKNLASFTVEVSGGVEPYRYQWVYTNDNWPDGTYSVVSFGSFNSSTLSFSAFTAAFDPRYQFRCIITDSAGNSITSNSVRLISPDGIEIVDQPDNNYAEAREYVEFRAKFHRNEGTLKYTWYYESDSMGATKITEDDSGWASGWDSEVLVIKANDSFFEHNYRFRCVASYGYYTATTYWAYICESDAKDFSLMDEPEDVYAEDGKYADVYLEISGQDDYTISPYSFRWQIYDGAWRDLTVGYGKEIFEQSHATYGYAEMSVKVNKNDPWMLDTPMRCIIEDGAGQICVSDTFEIHLK